MKFEPMTGDPVGGVSPVTTPNIVYAENSSLDCSSAGDISNIRAPKRGSLLPQIVIASSLLAFTTPLVSLVNLPLAGPTSLPTFDQTAYVGIEKSGRRITLREARNIALEAHYQFEEGLRIDRIREARLMELAVNENEA